MEVDTAAWCAPEGGKMQQHCHGGVNRVPSPPGQGFYA